MSRQGKKREATAQNIKQFWDDESNEIGSTPQVTIRDIYFRNHELHSISALIPSGSRLLDVGCGTGFGTVQLGRRARYTLGTDYSEKMIEWAHRLIDDRDYRAEIDDRFCFLGNMALPLKGQLEFRVSDILKPDPTIETFDMITGQRILINLPSHQDQMKALQNLRGYASDNGYLVLVEATLQGHRRTDDYRGQFGLSALEKYWHNIYVDESKFTHWRDSGWEITADLGFETYVLLSKVIYPAACGEENCEFLSGANAAAMEMATLFRSKASVDETGLNVFLDLYAQRVKSYDREAAAKIEAWIASNRDRLSDWGHIGHQRLILAKAV